MNSLIVIQGQMIDDQTRCIHYHSERDVIAIKFKCCNTYYPCYQCHEAEADHTAVQWPQEEWNTRAVLCGVCRYELTISEYMEANDACPSCGTLFNPGCRAHYPLYFSFAPHP